MWWYFVDVSLHVIKNYPASLLVKLSTASVVTKRSITVMSYICKHGYPEHFCDLSNTKFIIMYLDYVLLDYKRFVKTVVFFLILTSTQYKHIFIYSACISVRNRNNGFI